MTSERKKELRDLAMLLALDKLRTLSAIKAHLEAAVRECYEWQRSGSGFEDDPDIMRLLRAAEALRSSVPTSSYNSAIFEAITGNPSSTYDYTDASDVSDLRREEAGGSDNDVDVPLASEDPLALFLRLKDK
jgi:hypothetical protein